MPEALVGMGVAVRHPHAGSDAVGPVDLCISRGERVLLLGPSGAGKSSLLHALTGLIPQALPAEMRGTVRIHGRALAGRPADRAGDVGFLFQDAEQTLAGFTVTEEIAFGPENRSMPPRRSRARVRAAMARAGLPPDWGGRRIAALSGGERQLVALAALLAQGARMTIADEPTAALAPQAARRLADLLLAPGRTSLIVDHRLGPILDRIDRVMVLDGNGRMMATGPRAQVFADHGAAMERAGIWTPLPDRVARALGREVRPGAGPWSGPAQLTPAQLQTLRALILPDRTPQVARPGPALVRLEGAACAPPFGPVVLRGISLTMHSGQVLAILGPNGAGKSTLAACLAGLARPRAGQRHGPPGAVAFQNPEAHFSRESVRAELATVARDADALTGVLAHWGLSGVADQHPYTLSAGQKRRLALALLTASPRWEALILDEPTAGLDWRGSQTIAARIRALAAEGRAVAVITHDPDFALRVADRALVLAGGRIAADGPAETVLSDAALLARAGLAPPEAAALLPLLGGDRC